MKIIADTNIIIRFLIHDDLKQLDKINNIFKSAEEIIIPTHVFCELAWVLSSTYKLKYSAISDCIKEILQVGKLNIKEDEIQAGLSLLDAGGDFADGVNAYTGHAMTRGPSVFVSFDKQAVRLLAESGISAMVPA